MMVNVLLRAICLVCLLVASSQCVVGEESRFVDLSLLVAPEYPCTWAEGFPTFRLERTASIGRDSDYNIDTLIIDGNTGTQMDVAAHSVARPELKLPHSGPYGNEFTHNVPAWKFVGEACVIDIPELLEGGEPGSSRLVTKDMVTRWEQTHRPLTSGDVALFRSGYTDKYYVPLPEGRRFMADVLEKHYPGWPDPHPDTMDYLASHGVMHIGTDSPTMGPLPNLGEPVHYAALKYGAVFTEGATHLSQLPTTGAFYCMMGPKHQDGPYGEGRAFAIVGGDLPRQLIESARKQRVVDLSVVLSIDLPVTWSGHGVGRHRHRYTKSDFLFSDNLQLYHHGHLLDSQAGTHLVPPSFALPAAPIPRGGLRPETNGWRDEFERLYGPLGTSQMTTEQVPLAQMSGWVRVIDVRQHVGTTKRTDWPASPVITADDIRAFEAREGDLKAGEVVIFRTEHTDRHFLPRTAGNACLADPIQGKSEGWPAPNAAAIDYLASKRIGCVATDAPSLGGVDPKSALMTYWMLATRGLVGVEFLTNVGEIPAKAYFLFAPVNIRDCHGGPGRAIALY